MAAEDPVARVPIRMSAPAECASTPLPVATGRVTRMRSVSPVLRTAESAVGMASVSRTTARTAAPVLRIVLALPVERPVSQAPARLPPVQARSVVQMVVEGVVAPVQNTTSANRVSASTFPGVETERVIPQRTAVDVLWTVEPVSVHPASLQRTASLDTVWMMSAANRHVEVSASRVRYPGWRGRAHCTGPIQIQSPSVENAVCAMEVAPVRTWVWGRTL